MGREAIEQYLYMMNQAFDSKDGWHSLMKNVEAVQHDEWDWVPDYVAHMPDATSHGLCRLCVDFYYPVSSDLAG